MADFLAMISFGGDRPYGISLSEKVCSIILYFELRGIRYGLTTSLIRFMSAPINQAVLGGFSYLFNSIGKCAFELPLI